MTNNKKNNQRGSERKPHGKSQQKKPAQKNNGNGMQGPRPASRASRGAAMRASRQHHSMAEKLIDIHNVQEVSEKNKASILPVGSDKVLRLVALGGQDGIGEKNMQVLEYGNSAIILDCGMDLSVDLPGINYGIPDVSYLETIKHKIKGYVISHGHLDHIGGLPYIVPRYPAPIYGSHFTIGMVQKVMEDQERGVQIEGFKPQYVDMNMDNHDKLKVGEFTIELVRMTHSIPDGSAIIVDTPEGRIINTGDYRLDPEPLDRMPTDTERLSEFGKDGNTLLLMSDSTNAQRLGRTPTEHTLEQSFKDVIKEAPGRVFVASFSSNINRIQMIINAAVEAGRNVAIDGRSMLSTVELAVKLGSIKIPKGTVTTVKSMPKMPDDKVLIVATGGQGELNASLQRMSIGEHNHIKIKEGDTVVISSTPIPGNEVRYDQIADDLTRRGCRMYRAPTWEVDGSSGPLHVSGHGFREEHIEMFNYVKPKFFAPIYAGPLHRKYHRNNIIENAGMSSKNVFMLDNGQTLEFFNGKAKLGSKIPVGTQLIDDSGAIVTSVVVKDRLLMLENGIVSVILTIDKKTGQLMSSPDIITRGFIYMRDNEELMNNFRHELRRVVGQRFSRVDLDRFKQELKDHIQYYLFEHTQRSPIIIPVVNVINNGNSGRGGGADPKQLALKRAELRGHSQNN